MENKAYLNDKIKLKTFKEKLQIEEAYHRQLADKIKATKPYKRPERDSNLIRERFKQRAQLERGKLEENAFILKPNYICAERHSSLISDISNLKQIFLKEMFVNQIHKGNYIQFQTIAVPFYSSGMHLLVQDQNGDIEQLIIFNYETKSYYTDPNLLIPINTRLQIKEPYLQLTGLVDDEISIRVDSPSDLIILNYDMELIKEKSTDDIIDLANKEFNTTNYHSAIRLYTAAILNSNKTSSRAYLNRSQAYIKLEKYNSAYSDAKNAVSLDMNNQKAHFRCGKAAYLMRKFNLALESYEKCLKLNPHNQVEFELTKTRERLNESAHGSYNFKNLYEQFFKKEFNMDIADYRSNKFIIAEIENKSKGAVSIDLIPKGALILVSKAESAVFHNKVDYRKKSYNTVYFSKNNYLTKNESENIANIIYKMEDDSEFSNKIYSLYAGDQFSRENLEHPLIDIKRIEALYAFNSFEIKNSYETLEILELENELKKYDNYDEEEFEEIDLSLINFESKRFKQLAELQVKYNNLNKQCGLWYLSSFFNHSCISNCVVNTIGDVIIFTAERDIHKNEEITIRYFPPEWAYSDKIERGMDIYGFKCDCSLCKLDESDPLRMIRNELFSHVESIASDKKTTIDEISSCVEKIQESYSKRPNAKIELIHSFNTLANKYRYKLDYKNSIKLFNDMFELIKYYNDFYAVICLKEVMKDLKSLDENKQMVIWKNKAFEYFRTINMDKYFYEKLWNKIENFKY